MATLDQLAARITTLDRRVQDLIAMVERIDSKLGLTPPPAQVIADDRGAFLPGTGWTGQHFEPDEPEPPDIPVPFNEAAERAREAREELRRKIPTEGDE